MRVKLTSIFLFLMYIYRFLTTFERHVKTKTHLPSFLSGGQNRNDNKRKEYNMPLSEESGIG